MSHVPGNVDMTEGTVGAEEVEGNTSSSQYDLVLMCQNDFQFITQCIAQVAPIFGLY